ncbi:hypothetical protein CSUI_007010 [Cystoisospora suis]|uniref:Uncharacterized protein n=1 Tax=Cystoisospora suis TaxID=483139 RepID=A0A2C6KS28_9APIC|nr:hypothetical protein CSUI_007010 [Cystoisospora suis]
MKASTSGVHTPQNPPQEQSGTVLPLSSSSEQHDGGLHTSETAQAETVHPSINDRSKDTEGYSKRDNFAAKPSGESREVHHSLEKEQNPSTPPGNDKSPLLPTGSGRRELEEHVSRNLDSSPRRSLSRESKDETQEENSPLPASNLFSSRSDSQNVLHGTSNKPE